MQVIFSSKPTIQNFTGILRVVSGYPKTLHTLELVGVTNSYVQSLVQALHPSPLRTLCLKNIKSQQFFRACAAGESIALGTTGECSSICLSSKVSVQTPNGQ